MNKLRNNGIITDTEYKGKTLEVATKYAEDGGFSVRIVEVDGQPKMLDMSVNPSRLNFRIRNNKVIDVFGG